MRSGGARSCLSNQLSIKTQKKYSNTVMPTLTTNEENVEEASDDFRLPAIGGLL
jgi:hypothetical protein